MADLAQDLGFMLVSRQQNGTTHLAVHQFTLNIDSNGNTTGGVDIGGETTVGVSFAIDTSSSLAASTSGVVPLSRCTFDADFDTTGCEDAGAVCPPA